MNIARNSFIVFSSKIFIASLTFLSGVVIARILGPKGLGIYELFLAIAGMAVTLGSLGFGVSSIYFLNKEKKDISLLVSHSLIFGTCWGILLGAGAFSLFSFFPVLISRLPQEYWIFLLLVVPFMILHNFLLPFFLARFKVLRWSFLLVLYSFFVFAGAIGSLIFWNLGMQGIFEGITISGILIFLMIFFELFKITPLRFQFNRTLFFRQLQFGLKAWLGDIFNVISPKVNLFLVSIFLGIVSAGHYSIALNITSLLFFISFSFQQTLFPIWSIKKEEDIDRSTQKAAKQVLILGMGAMLALFLGGRYAILSIYGKEFLLSIIPLYILLPGIFFLILASIFFNNFFSRGKPYLASIILGGTLILNTILAVFMVPMFGIAGAAFSTSVSYFVAAILALLTFTKLARCSLTDVLNVRVSDLKSLFFQWKNIFRSGKFIELTPRVTLQSLKDYYEDKAPIEGPDILRTSFESPVFFKKLFYAGRTGAIMDFLNLKKEDRILEIGCGVGYYTKKIAERTSHVVATDISEEYVAQAKAYNPLPIENYIACPVERLPFEDNSFDVVLMSEVIEHLIDSEKGIKEIYRVLKPGGRAVIATPNKYSYLNVIYHMRVTFSGSMYDQDHIKEFSKGELSKLLARYFILRRFRYVNYFPVLLPHIIMRRLHIAQVQRIVETIETILNVIPLIRRLGFSMVFEVQKPIVTQRKTKVCHVASADISLRFLLFSFMKYIKQLGYEVWGVSAWGKWIPEIERAGIKVYTPQIVRKIFTPFADFKVLVHLISLFRKERFDIVHTHTLKASFFGQIAAFFAGVPIRIYTNHGLDFENPDFSPLKRKLFIYIDKIIANLVHVAFFVNKEDMEIAQKERIYKPGKMKYFGGSVNLEKFNPIRFSQEFVKQKKKELGIAPEQRVIGIVGRLVRDKGYFELFEAFKKILLQFSNSVLIIVGSLEPEKDDRFDMNVLPSFGIEKNTIYLGERTDIEEIYSIMDVFALPTHREGLGVSILEASAMKIPVVATDISGCRGSVNNGETGILVPPKNSEKLAEAILYLLENPQIAEAMGQAGRKKVEQEFSEKVVFERVRMEYERLLKEKLRV